MHYPRQRHLAGLTLAELAISLTIIAFLIGAIFVGRELIGQGEARLITRELARCEAAYATFRDKYDALPGDMTNAAAIWGIAGGTVGNDAACQNTQSFNGTTCSGDGDGVIMTSKISSVTQDETHRAWQHLKNAGLIDGKFGGSASGASASDLISMVDYPSQVKGVGFQFFYESKATEGWTNAPEGSGNLQVLRVAAPTAGSPPYLGTNAITPFDAFSIDDKIDDGNPASGKVFVPYNSNCVTSADATKTGYILTGTASGTIACMINYDLTK